MRLTEYAGMGVLALACFAMTGGNPARSAPAAAAHRFDSIQETKYPWGWIRWMMNAKVEPGAAQTFGIVEIAGKGRNTLHKHPNCEELLYVLSGTATHQIGDQKVEIKKGDLIRVPANTPHMAIVTSAEPLRAVISYSSGDRQVIDLGPGKE